MLIIDAIVQLNDTFCIDEFSTPPFFGFEYRTDGYCEAVEFMGIRIWCSEDETRLFNYDTLEFEPYEDCFKRGALEIINTLKKTEAKLLN